MSTPPPFNRAEIERHVHLLHELAAATLASDRNSAGVLILLPIREGDTPRPQRFAIGDERRMVEAIMAFDRMLGVNIYAPYCTMFSDLHFGAKGGEKNVLWVFAAVADIDRDPGKPVQAEIPIRASYVIESSPGNYQCVYIFRQPICAKAAKPVLAAMHDAIGGDAAQKDVSHVWRIPGTLNWPTKSKLARGRSPEPAPVTVVRPCNGVRVDPAAILALPPLAKPRKSGDPKSTKTTGTAKADIPKLRSALARIPADDRGVWVTCGMALHTIGARDLWDEWAKTNAKFDAADQARVWDSFKDDRDDKVTVATIYKLAKERGWKPPRQPRQADSVGDDYVALAVADKHGEALGYVADGRQWLLWTEVRWEMEKTLAVFDLARKTSREITLGTEEPANGRT